MNVLWEMFNDSDYVSAAPHSAALNVFDLESSQVGRTDRLGRVPQGRQAAGQGLALLDSCLKGTDRVV